MYFKKCSSKPRLRYRYFQHFLTKRSVNIMYVSIKTHKFSELFRRSICAVLGVVLFQIPPRATLTLCRTPNVALELTVSAGVI